MKNYITEISAFVGKEFFKIEKTDDEIIFFCKDGIKFKMYHEQDCCEGVSIDDINGDLDDLLNTPILKAEEVNNESFENAFNSKFNLKNKYGSEIDIDGNYRPDSYTWTFYKLATKNGYVDIRWYGESNGYYSESVDVIWALLDNEFKRYEFN